MVINGNLNIVGKLTTGELELSQFLDVSSSPKGLLVDPINGYLIYKIDNEIIHRFPTEEKISELTGGVTPQVVSEYVTKEKTLNNLLNRALFPVFDSSTLQLVGFNLDETVDYPEMSFALDKFSFLHRDGEDMTSFSYWLQPYKSVQFFENHDVLPRFSMIRFEALTDSTEDSTDLIQNILNKWLDHTSFDITNILDMLVFDETTISRMDINWFPVFWIAQPNSRLSLVDYKNAMDKFFNDFIGWKLHISTPVMLPTWVKYDTTNEQLYAHLRFFDYSQFFINQIAQLVKHVITPVWNGDITTQSPLLNFVNQYKIDNSISADLDLTQVGISFNPDYIFEDWLHTPFLHILDTTKNNIFINVLKQNVESLNNTSYSDMDTEIIHNVKYNKEEFIKFYIDLPNYIENELFVPLIEFQIELRNHLDMLI